jgi:hypothetical protein
MNLAVPNALYQGTITDKETNIYALDVLGASLTHHYQHWFTAYQFNFNDIPNFYQFKLILDNKITPVVFCPVFRSQIDLQSLECAIGKVCIVRLKKVLINGVARPMVAEVLPHEC